MPNLQENMKESLKKSGHSIIIVFFLLIWKIFHASQGIKVMFSVKRSVQPWQIVTSSISFSRISTSNHLGLHCNNVGSISQSTDWSSKVSIWKSESMCSARFLFCWSLECSSQSASRGWFSWTADNQGRCSPSMLTSKLKVIENYINARKKDGRKWFSIESIQWFILITSKWATDRKEHAL